MVSTSAKRLAVSSVRGQVRWPQMGRWGLILGKYQCAMFSSYFTLSIGKISFNKMHFAAPVLVIFQWTVDATSSIIIVSCNNKEMAVIYRRKLCKC